MSQTLLRRIVFSLLALVMLAPMAVVAGVSLNEKKALTFPPQGINLSWYGALFLDEGWSRALTNSVTIALLSALVALAIAFPLAWFGWRYKVKGAHAITALGMAPFLLPPVIIALGFLTFWTQWGFYGAPWTVVVSHGVLLVSLPLVSLILGFASLDPALAEAASSMGASEGKVLRTIVLPLMRPFIISGYAFAFVISLNEYIVTFMTVGPFLETLPMKIFNSMRYGYTPVMAAASVFFVLVTVGILALVARFGDLPRLMGAPAK